MKHISKTWALIGVPVIVSVLASPGHAAARANQTVTVTCGPIHAPDFGCCDEGDILTVVNGCPGTAITLSFNGGDDVSVVVGGSRSFTCTVGADKYRVVSVPLGAAAGVEDSVGDEACSKLPTLPGLGLIGLGVILAGGGAVLLSRRRAGAK